MDRLTELKLRIFDLNADEKAELTTLLEARNTASKSVGVKMEQAWRELGERGAVAWSDTGHWDDFHTEEPDQFSSVAHIYLWEQDKFEKDIERYQQIILDANAALNDFDNPNRPTGQPPARMEFQGEVGKIIWGAGDGIRRFLPDRQKPHPRHYIKEIAQLQHPGPRDDALAPSARAEEG